MTIPLQGFVARRFTAAGPRARLNCVALLVASLLVIVLVVAIGDPTYRRASLAVALLPWLVVAAGVEIRRVHAGRGSAVVPLVIVGLPFLHVVLPSPTSVAVAQGALLVAVVFSFGILSAERRAAALRRSLPVLAPVGLLVGLIVLGYLGSYLDGGTAPRLYYNGDPYFAADLAATVACVVLAGICVDSPAGLERLVSWIVVSGIAQAGVVLAQVLRLTSHLPSRLQGLGTSGLISTATGGRTVALAGRYGGSFGDYELLAEFSVIVLILCVGVLTFDLAPARRGLYLVGAAAAGACGIMTGTRAFAVGAVMGIGVLVLGASFQADRGRPRSLRRLTAAVVVAAAAIVLLVPEQQVSAFIGRFDLASAALTGTNPLNRGDLYRAAFRAVHGMPWTGYGVRMMDVFQGQFPNYLIRSPHSLYLTALLIAGWAGLVAVIALGVALLAMTLVTARSPVSRRYRQWGVVLLAIVVFWVADESKIEFLRYPFYVAFTFVLLGAVGATFSLARERPRVAAEPPSAPLSARAGGADTSGRTS